MKTKEAMKTAPAVKKPGYIMIGGFLGAGKTTAVGKLAAWLRARGLRAGLITNDQGRNLVDTTLLRAQGFATEEIPGGCFCGRFDALVEAVQKLRSEIQPDFYIAEPVGSCIDLVATVAYPLRKLHRSQCNLRAEAAPHILGGAVSGRLAAAAFPTLTVTPDHLEHFRPDKPMPTHRLTRLAA
jgi:hypothetical protein